jgi:5-methylcytosine-specific restriction enzyme A
MRERKKNNPKWIRDEEILLADLYFTYRNNIPGPQHSEVIELSRLLEATPWHSLESRASTFRNPTGIALKLQNLKCIETGYGMRNVAAIDRQILDEFASRQDQLSEMAAAIRKGIGLVASLEIAEADLEQNFMFTEGRLLTAIHLRRERDPRLRKALLRERQRKDRVCCDLCGASFETFDAIHRMAAFEVHHLVPLTSSGLSRRTTLHDVALLCAVCHRLMHSAIAAQGKWLHVSQARAILLKQ